LAVFARKASGLTKEASLLDAFLFGFMNEGIGVTLWNVHSWTYYTFPGGNLILASIITAFLTIFGVALAWGILGGSMPRSGGDYIYNSRILHPAVGTATSWAQGLFTMTAWIWILAPWVANPGIPVLAGTLGIPLETVEFWTTPIGMLIVASVINVLSFIIVVSGFRIYLIIQRTLFLIGMIGLIIAFVLLSMVTRESFISIWNAIAAQYGSPSFEETISLAKEAGYVKTTWDWVATLGMVPTVTWVLSYGFCIGYIGGEVKRPERNILGAQIIAALVPSFFCVWLGYLLQNKLGYEFAHAIAYIDNERPEWYTMPFPPTYANLAAILTNNIILKFLIGINFIIFDFIWIPISYLIFARVLFAQGMDQIGPRWFTDLHPRFNTPVKLYVLELILGEAAIIHYCFFPEVLGGLSITGLDALTVWGILGISVMLFPFVKKVRHIWEASPHRWRKTAVMSGILSLILVGIVIWAIYTSPAMGGLNIVWTPIYILVGVAGISWYYFWKWKRSKEGIDVTLAFKELPPE
jgi:amino acid transporter